MGKKRILIVDDEQHVLDGLNRALRVLAEEWKTDFAVSGAEALKLLEKSRFDVIITDMQMPGMTGNELLILVREKYSHMLRIVLSGEVGHTLEGRALDVAHQVLMKPCTPKDMLEAVDRADFMRKRSLENSQRERISALNLPEDYINVAARVRQQISSTGEVNEKNIADFFEEDGHLYTKVQQVEECFSKNDSSSSPMTPGVDVILAVAILTSVEETWGPWVSPEYSLNRFWKKSFSVARSALMLARAEKLSEELQRTIFLAGLYHSIGQLLLAAGNPEGYQKVLRGAEGADSKIPELEKEIFSVTSESLGAWYLSRWDIDEAVVEAVACQRVPGMLFSKHFLPVVLLHVARTVFYQKEETIRTVLDIPFLESVDVAEKLSKWSSTITTVLKDRTVKR